MICFILNLHAPVQKSRSVSLRVLGIIIFFYFKYHKASLFVNRARNKCCVINKYVDFNVETCFFASVPDWPVSDDTVMHIATAKGKIVCIRKYLKWDRTAPLISNSYNTKSKEY